MLNSFFDFIILKHFFQFFELLFLLTFFILFYIIKSIILKYPDILLDSLSILKIVTYPFKNKFSSLKETHSHIEFIDKKYEEYNSLYNKKIRKLFYPFPETLLISILGGYLFYFFTGFDSSFIFNIASFILIFICFKKFNLLK